VENGKEATIFRFVKQKPLKNVYAKELLKYIEDKFRTLPFAERWLQDIVPEEHYREAFQELLRSKALMNYHIFIEESRKPVSQAEHTVLAVKEGSIVLT
jgi:methionyl aminopeptidase